MKAVPLLLLFSTLFLAYGNREKVRVEEHDASDTIVNLPEASSKEMDIQNKPEDKGSHEDDPLVGVWQDSRTMATGWSTAYQFFADGTFILNENQMDCAKRLVWSKGGWERTGTDGLELRVTEWLRLEGGRMIESDGSCVSDSMLVGASEKSTRFEDPKRITLSVGPTFLSRGDDDPERATVEINGTKYYRFSDDPSEYP